LTLLRKCLLPFWISFLSLTLHASDSPSATVWLTTPDRSALIARQSRAIIFGAEDTSESLPSIDVDDRRSMQTIDGFGFALTGGSAQLLMRMTPPKRHALIEELFKTGKTGFGVSYLRVSIGSSDMNDRVLTYDDLPPGQTDPNLEKFQLGPDLNDVVPVLQEILKISPEIKIMATPWSAPSWMKTNGLQKGGSLKPEFYKTYALYLARYVESMANRGIHIDAITPQNEPLNPKNTPSMVVTADEEASFIKQALGPTFRRQQLATKIVIYDHNCDRPDYPLTILADKVAAQYVDGSGFHLYGGTIDAMTRVHDAFPDKNIYFSEQMVIDNPKDGPELRLARPVKEIVIGATSNWSRNVLLWNLAADRAFGPHTGDGGCPICEGAITLDGDRVTRNVAFYTIAQVSKFVPPGSMRVASTPSGDTPAQVAFSDGNGRIILLVSNVTNAEQDFGIRFHGKVAKTSIPAGSVATYVWQASAFDR
jgi:glucosylceramidase